MMLNGSDDMSKQPWLQLYPKEIPTTLTYDDKPVHAFLKESAEKSPNQVFIHFLGKELTYREVYESALKFAAYLKKIGLEKGERVAISLPNCPQFVISYFGILIRWWNSRSNKPYLHGTRIRVPNERFRIENHRHAGCFISTCRQKLPQIQIFNILL